jgi:Ca-activated chloride channel family protein
VEFTTRSEIERSEMNEEVIKAVQFLMNARARNEAMRRLDRGDYAGAEFVIGSALSATQGLGLASAPGMMEEMASLQDTASSLKDRLKDRMSRKKMAYAAYSRRTSK